MAIATTPPATYAPGNESAIAAWILPQYEDATDTITVGLAAYHLTGIDRVEYYTGPGLEWDLTGETTDPTYDERGYWATIELVGEGWVDITAKVIPSEGVTLTMGGSYLDDRDYCGLAVYSNPDPEAPVTVPGDFATIGDAISYGAMNIYLEGGEYMLPEMAVGRPDREATRYVTITGNESARVVGGGPLDGAVRYVDVQFLPNTLEDADGLLFMSGKSTRVMRGCLVNGLDRCSRDLEIWGNDNGIGKWAYQSRFEESFGMHTFRVASHVFYTGQLKDIAKSDKLSLYSNVTVKDHGEAYDLCGSAVHPDFWQTTGGTGSNALTDMTQYNKVFRYNDYWSNKGRQVVYGSFRAQEAERNVLSRLVGFAFIGNRLGNWVGLEDPADAGSSVLWWLSAPMQNVIIADNLMCGRTAVVRDADEDGLYTVFDGSQPRRYMNVLWARNYFNDTNYAGYFVMPLPDGPEERVPFADSDVDDSLRFQYGVDTFPWLSQITGMMYEAEPGDQIAYSRLQDLPSPPAGDPNMTVVATPDPPSGWSGMLALVIFVVIGFFLVAVLGAWLDDETS